MRWPLISLGEVTQDRPICYGVLKPGPKTPGGVPLIRVTDISKHKLDFSDLYHISEDLSREFRRSVLNGTEVLLSIQGTVGKCALASPEIAGANISRTIAQIQPDSRLNRSFLRYWFLHKESRHQISGSTRASLNIGSIRKYKIPLPPLEEQKRIARILDEADLVRKKTQDLIDKYDELAQSLFLDMFGDPVTNPKRWEMKPLRKLCEVTNGFAFQSANYIDSGVRIIRIANVQKGVVTDDHPKFYPLQTLGEYARFGLKERDLVMSLTGNVGRVGLMPHQLLPAFLNQRVACLRPNTEKIRLEFLFQILNSDIFERQAVFNSSGVAQLNLSSKWVENFPVILPDYVLQSKFVDLIQDVSKCKIALERTFQKEDTLFSSLLQKAFKGELT
jgi:type I restriction enzyme S subunit